jgi:hypothetical protein
VVAVVAVVVAIHVRALVPAVCPVQRHVLQRGLFILCWLGFGPTVRKFAVASGAWSTGASKACRTTAQAQPHNMP